MWPNPQFTADLPPLLKKSLMENFIFCAVQILNIYMCSAEWMLWKKSKRLNENAHVGIPFQ